MSASMRTSTFLRSSTKMLSSSMSSRAAFRPTSSSASAISSSKWSTGTSSRLSMRPLSFSAVRLNENAEKAKEAEKKDAAGQENTASIEEVSKKVKELEETVKELKSQLTYGKADFINLQRRSEQEKSSMRDFAIQGFASDLLSTIDILTLALKHVKQPIPAENTELKTLYQGVDMTKQELLKVLAKHGVTQFDPTGEKFDPNTMEAMYQAPVPGKEPGSVLDCQKLGYMLKSRTLRPAQVGVVQGQ